MRSIIPSGTTNDKKALSLGMRYHAVIIRYNTIIHMLLLHFNEPLMTVSTQKKNSNNQNDLLLIINNWFLSLKTGISNGHKFKAFKFKPI